MFIVERFHSCTKMCLLSDYNKQGNIQSVILDENHIWGCEFALNCFPWAFYKKLPQQSVSSALHGYGNVPKKKNTTNTNSEKQT